MIKNFVGETGFISERDKADTDLTTYCICLSCVPEFVPHTVTSGATAGESINTTFRASMERRKTITLFLSLSCGVGVDVIAGQCRRG
jgi:hypothetical protein